MKKFLLCLTVCSLFCFSFSRVSLAEEVDSNTGNNVYIIEDDDPIPYYDPNIESQSIHVLPTRYDQNNYSQVLGACSATTTIKNGWCALVSLAMVRDYFIGKPYQDPAALNNSFMKPQGLCGMNWDKIGAIGLSKVVAKTNLDYSYTNNNMTAFGDLIAPYLDSGYLIIARLGPASHYIVVRGYSKLTASAGGGYNIYVTNSGYSEWSSIYAALHSNFTKITEIIVIKKA